MDDRYSIAHNVTPELSIDPRFPDQVWLPPGYTDFNEVVSLDLNENTKYPSAPPYILYAVCLFTMFRLGVFIEDKKSQTVAEAWDQ